MANHGNLYGPSFTFLGIPACDLEEEKSYTGADVVIVGAPVDGGTSHRSGTNSDQWQFVPEITCLMMVPVHI